MFADKKARELKITNIWTKRTVTSLNKYKPSDYPLFKEERLVMFLVISIMTGNLIYYIRYARKGGEIFLRSIPGLKAVEDDIARGSIVQQSVHSSTANQYTANRKISSLLITQNIP